MKLVTFFNKGKVQTMSLDELKTLKGELTSQWEKACKNCGKCCFDKSLNDNGVLFIDYNKPCQYLKYLGRKAQCKIYEKRFDIYSKCSTVPEAISKRALPADCPYTKSVVGYKPPVDNSNWLKRARAKLSRYDEEAPTVSCDTPTGGTRDSTAKLPPRITAMEAQNLTREDLGKPAEWKRRRAERKRRAEGGPQGTIDPREKVDYNVKPSGHALGG